MYLVRDNDYPKLDIYLCYDCGFYYVIILKNQKGLYREYEKCFIHFKEKGIIMKLKNYDPITSPRKINNGIKQLMREQNLHFLSYIIITRHRTNQ